MLDCESNQSIVSVELARDQDAMERLFEAMGEFAELHEAAAQETYRLAQAHDPRVEDDAEDDADDSGAGETEGITGTMGGRSEVARRIRKMLTSFQ